MLNENFLTLLRLAMGISDELPGAMSADEWQQLHAMAYAQALVGIMYQGVEKLPEEQRPPKDLMMTWYTERGYMMAKNRMMNQECVRLTEFFAKNGFRSCILKGQGNTLMYRFPLLRQPGDIDIWVEGGQERVVSFLKSKGLAYGLESYHHVDMRYKKGVSVEVHYRPSPGHYNPFTKKKLHRFLTGISSEQFDNHVGLPEAEGTVSVPTVVFNRTYQLSHMFCHYLPVGVELRHLMDYYYLLLQPSGDVADEPARLKELGLYRFATAVMWVLGELFRLDRSKMVVEPDERLGRQLLENITVEGASGKKLLEEQYSGVSYVLMRAKRMLKMALNYPSDVWWWLFHSVRLRLP